MQAGDIMLMVGMHVTTKEIDDWVWATFWWHDRPDVGVYATERPASVTGRWRNYLMAAAYDLESPKESDNTPVIAFNPYLEAGFRNGILSNCMNCHNRASWRANWPVSPPPDNRRFLPIFRGQPAANDPSFAPGKVRTDFLWSIPMRAQ
jgi:hypothetical protein